ncbi:hypothetical protein [Hugenholtzia roseola]|uniref:hypothetical protein n=1 Tax=Hugenholtzia roseola TaxID=1002 RepID=UPI00040B5730|nr:hypothetical protein [Hugenholtzia roseola]
MLTYNELATLLEDAQLEAELEALKAAASKDLPLLQDLGQLEFAVLVLLTPAVGIALAQGNISLFEELSLQRKIKRLLHNQVEEMYKVLKSSLPFFAQYQDDYYGFIGKLTFSTFHKNPLFLEGLQKQALTHSLALNLLHAPWILVKLLSFLFLEEDEQLSAPPTFSAAEFEKIIEIGRKTGISKLPLFEQFCQQITVK